MRCRCERELQRSKITYLNSRVIVVLELYNNGRHACLMFTDLVDDEDGSTAPLKGKQVTGRFLDWIESLAWGVDLMTQQMYTAPRQVIVAL